MRNALPVLLHQIVAEPDERASVRSLLKFVCDETGAAAAALFVFDSRRRSPGFICYALDGAAASPAQYEAGLLTWLTNTDLPERVFFVATELVSDWRADLRRSLGWLLPLAGDTGGWVAERVQQDGQLDGALLLQLSAAALPPETARTHEEQQALDLCQLWLLRHFTAGALVQQAALAEIGRLLPAVVHQVNNAMQATGGALDLALEEIEDPVAVEEYLQISRQETRRVIHLAAHLRQLYLPPEGGQERANLAFCLDEMMALAGNEMARRGAVIGLPVFSATVRVACDSEQLTLALTGFLLRLTEILYPAGRIEIGLADGEAGAPDAAWPNTDEWLELRVELERELALADAERCLLRLRRLLPPGNLVCIHVQGELGSRFHLRFALAGRND